MGPSGRFRRCAVLPKDLLRQLLETWITGHSPQFFPWHRLQGTPKVVYQIQGLRIERPSGLVEGMAPGSALIHGPRHRDKTSPGQVVACPSRFETTVRLRNRSKAIGDIISGVERQRQFPSARRPRAEFDVFFGPDTEVLRVDFHPPPFGVTSCLGYP